MLLELNIPLVSEKTHTQARRICCKNLPQMTSMSHGIIFRLRHASTAVTVKRNTRNCCRSSNIQNVARSGSFSREKNNQTGSSEGQHLAETTAASASHRDEDPVVSNNSSEDDGKQGNDNNDMDGRNVPTGSTTVVVASSSVTEGKAPPNSHKAAVTGGRE